MAPIIYKHNNNGLCRRPHQDFGLCARRRRQPFGAGERQSEKHPDRIDDEREGILQLLRGARRFAGHHLLLPGVQQGRTHHPRGVCRHTTQCADELRLLGAGRSVGHRHSQADQHDGEHRCRPHQAPPRPRRRQHREPGRHLCRRLFQ